MCCWFPSPRYLQSIATIRDLEAGHILTENDIHLLSPGDGFKWNNRDIILGKRLKNNLPKDEIIYPKDIE